MNFIASNEDNFIGFMKDAMYAFLRMIALIILISVIIIGNYELPYYIFTQDDITDDYTYVMDNFYTDKSSSANDVEKLNDFIETLPPVFIREFRNNWMVIVADYIPVPVDLNNSAAVGGYTSWYSRIIFIKRQMSFADTLDIFVHELGHCFDFEYGSVSYSYLFGDVYDLYKDDFKEKHTISPDGYATSSSVEFFATCFREYMLYPKHLKTVAPEAYNFIDYFYKNIQDIKYIYIYDLGAVGNIVLRLGKSLC
jgi:hypothetical protein